MMKRTLLKPILALCIVSFLVGEHCLTAQSIRTVASQERLYRAVADNAYSVVLFTFADRDASKEDKNEIRCLEYAFKATAQELLFKESDVRFISVNVARIGKDLIMQQYGIECFPAIVLFDRGQALCDAQLTGMVSRGQIIDFITQYWAEDLQEIIAAKDEQRERRLTEAQIRYYSTPWWNYGYGCWQNPYGYWGGCGGWGGCRPGFGAGFCW